MLSDPLIARHRAAAFTRPRRTSRIPAIRNKGTIGGSVALADPASEFPAMTLAMDAETRNRQPLRNAPRASR